MRLDVSEAQLRRVVDGAVRDALNMHPEYLTERGRAKALNGIAKRVTGALKGFAAQAAEGRWEPAGRDGG